MTRDEAIVLMRDGKICEHGTRLYRIRRGDLERYYPNMDIPFGESEWLEIRGTAILSAEFDRGWHLFEIDPEVVS